MHLLYAGFDVSPQAEVQLAIGPVNNGLLTVMLTSTSQPIQSLSLNFDSDGQSGLQIFGSLNQLGLLTSNEITIDGASIIVTPNAQVIRLSQIINV